MRIAISTDGEFVSAHFGRCPSFTLVDIDNGTTVSKEVLDNPGMSLDLFLDFCIREEPNVLFAAGWEAGPPVSLVNLE